MLDIKFIRKNADLIKKSARDKHLKIDIDKLLKIDEERVKIIQEMDALRAEQNKLSKTKPSDEIVKKLKKSKTEIADFEKKLSDINELNFKDLGHSLQDDEALMQISHSIREKISYEGHPNLDLALFR